MKKRVTKKTIGELTVRDGLVIYFLILPFCRAFDSAISKELSPILKKWTKKLNGNK